MIITKTKETIVFTEGLNKAEVTIYLLPEPHYSIFRVCVKNESFIKEVEKYLEGIVK